MVPFTVLSVGVPGAIALFGFWLMLSTDERFSSGLRFAGLGIGLSATSFVLRALSSAPSIALERATEWTLTGGLVVLALAVFQGVRPHGRSF